VRFCDELVARVTRAGVTAVKLLRADSGLWNGPWDPWLGQCARRCRLPCSRWRMPDRRSIQSMLRTKAPGPRAVAPHRRGAPLFAHGAFLATRVLLAFAASMSGGSAAARFSSRISMQGPCSAHRVLGVCRCFGLDVVGCFPLPCSLPAWCPPSHWLLHPGDDGCIPARAHNPRARSVARRRRHFRLRCRRA
jgi:hypothetical protein